MSSDLFQCHGVTSRGKRCKRVAVRAIKSGHTYVCPTHIGSRILIERRAVPPNNHPLG